LLLNNIEAHEPEQACLGTNNKDKSTTDNSTDNV